MKVGPCFGDAICSSAMQLLMRSVERKKKKKKGKERKRAEKHWYPFGIPVMKRDEKTGGGIRKAEREQSRGRARSCVCFLSFFLSQHCSMVTNARCYNLLLFGEGAWGRRHYKRSRCQTARIPVLRANCCL